MTTTNIELGDQPCKVCGGNDYDPLYEHRDDCPTINTCAQCHTGLPRDVWHSEFEWFDGDYSTYSVQLRAHILAAHPGHPSVECC